MRPLLKFVIKLCIIWDRISRNGCLKYQSDIALGSIAGCSSVLILNRKLAPNREILFEILFRASRFRYEFGLWPGVQWYSHYPRDERNPPLIARADRSGAEQTRAIVFRH